MHGDLDLFSGSRAAKDRVSALTTHTTRVMSVDVLRGLAMVIMALDHTRNFFSYLPFEPEDMSHTYRWLFFTRMATHFLLRYSRFWREPVHT